jgi:hypothetical protein
VRPAAEERVYPAVSAFAQDAAPLQDLRPDAADSYLGGVEHQDEMVDERRAPLDELPFQAHQMQQDASPPVESGEHYLVYWDYLAAASVAAEI